MTKKLLATLLALVMVCTHALADNTAKNTQNVRGTVLDVASSEPMIGVTILIDNNTQYGTVTDMDGNFCIERVPVGRHTVAASYVGYESVVLKEQLLSSGKELVLNLKMRELTTELGEIVVKPRVNKQLPLNEMSQVGARMFSVEEASRYAGGMADPARTASMFAGVATGGATNGISIHGNSPQMLQWRIEGIEVNNPNHFAEITGAGGGIFTSLNGSVLANSDFMTGAMPAEFGNALSGAFDMKMRVGNNTRYEHSVQVGTLGVDVASEGPLGKKGSRASYLVNYRYSFLEIAKKLHAINMEKETLDYQDLSFKLNFPTQNAGTLSVWFTGLYDNYKNELPDKEDWETLWDMNDSHSKQASYAGGVTHSYRFHSGGLLRSNIAMTGYYTRLGQNDYDYDLNLLPCSDARNMGWNLIFDLQHQQKFSSRYTMQTGFNHTHYQFDSWMDYIEVVGGPMNRILETDGMTGLTRLYSNHKLELTRNLSAVAGVNLMWFSLNDQWLVEPRVSLSYKATPSSTIAVAYALNSRKENIDTYFVRIKAPHILVDGHNTQYEEPNKELGLTRSHHISMTYSQRLGDNAMLKVEPYWQYLFDVPVEEGTTYSIINHTSFFQDKALVNEGAGRNYGIDLTLERYLKDGLYGMFTATLFKSEYRDAQGLWHNTRNDRGFITNILGGKEWMVGRDRKNVFGLNGRLTLMGGDRYSPIDENATFDDVYSRPDKSIPTVSDKPYTEQLGINPGFAFSLKYTINRQNASHHFIIEYLKMSSFNGQTYTLKDHKVKDHYTSLTFPNIAYRYDF